MLSSIKPFRQINIDNDIWFFIRWSAYQKKKKKEKEKKKKKYKQKEENKEEKKTLGEANTF